MSYVKLKHTLSAIALDAIARPDRAHVADALLAFHEEVHLGTEGSSRFFGVKLGEKRVVFAIENAPGVEAFGKDFGECGFSDAQRPFDDDESRRLRAPLRDGGSLG